MLVGTPSFQKTWKMLVVTAVLQHTRKKFTGNVDRHTWISENNDKRHEKC